MSKSTYTPPTFGRREYLQKLFSAGGEKERALIEASIAAARGNEFAADWMAKLAAEYQAQKAAGSLPKKRRKANSIMVGLYGAKAISDVELDEGIAAMAKALEVPGVLLDQMERKLTKATCYELLKAALENSGGRVTFNVEVING